MSDKGGGFFDNPFGGFFDFNGDGKEDPVEIFLAYKMFDEMTKEDNDSDSLEDDLWWDFCDDGSEYSVDPYEYDSEEEYKEVLKDAKSEYFTTSTVHPSRAYASTHYDQTGDIGLSESHERKLSRQDLPLMEEANTTVSAEEYRNKRANAIFGVMGSVFLIILFSLFPCAIIYNMVKSSTDVSGAASLFSFIASGVALVGLFFIISMGRSVIVNITRNFSNVKKSYLSSLSDDEINLQNRLRKKRRAILCRLTGIAVAAVIGCSLICCVLVVKTYSRAEALVQSGQYEQAMDFLHKIEYTDYKDTRSLLLLCKAKIEYAENNFYDAYYTMKDAKFPYQEKDMLNEINRFRKELSEKYNQ